MRELKTNLPGSVKGIDGRNVTGICAVFGNVDAGRDRMWPGSFTKTIAEAGRNAKHLWNHSFYDPPTAVIKSLAEVGRDALPADVLTLAPEATGGLEVTREYLNTERADEILEGITKGAINQMSFGFDPKKWDFTDNGGEAYSRVRELREVQLLDTSDVLWGMNDATVASKSFKNMPLELILSALAFHVSSIKADAPTPAFEQNRQLVTALVKAALDLGWSGDLKGVNLTSTSQTASRAEDATPPAATAPEAGASLTEVSAKLEALTLSIGD
jgi:HK97 family phage prohead protease